MTKLSDIQRVILSAAAQHEMGLATAPKDLPAAARTAVFRSMLKNNLLTEINAPREFVGLAWRRDEEGTAVVLRITDEGLRAIGVDPNEADTASPAASAAEPAPQEAPAAGGAHGAPTAPDERGRAEDLALLDAALAGRQSTTKMGLRGAAAAVLIAWDDEASRAADVIAALDGPMRALRAALAGKPARATREPGAARKPREGTKQEAVLALLRRPEGASVAQIAEATGWAPHTVRGFFAGLKK